MQVLDKRPPGDLQSKRVRGPCPTRGLRCPVSVAISDRALWRYQRVPRGAIPLQLPVGRGGRRRRRGGGALFRSDTRRRLKEKRGEEFQARVGACRVGSINQYFKSIEIITDDSIWAPRQWRHFHPPLPPRPPPILRLFFPCRTEFRGSNILGQAGKLFFDCWWALFGSFLAAVSRAFFGL